MTDIMKLADDYAEQRHTQGAPGYNAVSACARAALQSAIEALQATQNNLFMRIAHDVVTIECLNDKVMALRYEVDAIAGIKAERDALQSRLDAMRKGEPVAYLFTDIQAGDIEVSLYEDEKPRSQWHRAALYAAPNALAPLTDDSVNMSSPLHPFNPLNPMSPVSVWASSSPTESSRSCEPTPDYSSSDCDTSSSGSYD